MLNEEREVLEYIKEAFSLRARKLYKPAVEMLYKALTLDNDNIEILYQLGELYALMENYTRATGYLDQVIAKNSEHIESLKLYQRICETQNELDKSLKFAEKLFDINKNSENLKEIITLLSKLNQTDNLEKYADSEFLNSDIIFEIANALYSNGETEKAKKLLITRQNDNCAQINILLGKIYFDENNLQKSKEIFAAFDKNCDNPEVLNYRGLFALEDMNFTDAIKFFSKASSINKNNHIYLYNLGNAYFLNGWMEEAQNAYSRAIYLAPENTDYRYSLAYLYYEIKKADKCKKEVDAILEASPNHYPTRVLKALLLDNDKEYMQAKNILEENVTLGADDDFTLIALGKTYSYLDMYEKAEHTIWEVIKRNPENTNYLTDLADIFITEKKFNEATELIKKVIKINPNYVYGHVLGAKISYHKGDMETCKSYAQQAILLDMNCSEGYYYLAMVRFNEQDYEETIECMKRAITYDATNPKYYAEMSKIYKAKNDIKTALEYISEAESIDDSTEYKLMYQELATLNRKKSK